jgi:hypothetical protein
MEQMVAMDIPVRPALKALTARMVVTAQLAPPARPALPEPKANRATANL